ncbi:hypothetical protein [Nocardia sp. NPDC047648]|uniref:hypothetical protein n=1 Tax=Nocardia sp. NPDC047648 TaxID=3155625 RepID=UPI0033CF2328
MVVVTALGDHRLVRRNSEPAGKRRVPDLDAAAGELRLRPWQMSSADVDLVREAADDELIPLITTVPSVYTAEVLAVRAGCEGIAGTAVVNWGRHSGSLNVVTVPGCVPRMGISRNAMSFIEVFAREQSGGKHFQSLWPNFAWTAFGSLCAESFGRQCAEISHSGSDNAVLRDTRLRMSVN